VLGDLYCRLSSLGIWSSVLDPANITALYAYGLAGVPYVGNATNPYQPFLVSNEAVPEAEPAPAPSGESFQLYTCCLRLSQSVP